MDVQLDTVQKLDNALKIVIMQGMINSVYTNNPEWLIKLLIAFSYPTLQNINISTF
jgi:hypothetical protein